MSNVQPLHPLKHPVRHLVRIGHTGHRALENLHTAGRAPISRAVLDAGHSLRQKELVATLSDDGAEIILDTKAAELATPAGILSKADELPWANRDRPQGPSDWAGQRGAENANKIADFAVARGVHTVLSPAHFLQDAQSHWLVTDIEATHKLRIALDQRGGADIRVDYHLMVPIGLLRDAGQVGVLLERLRRASVGNVWLRVSGFGMNGSPAGTKHFIEAAWAFSKLNKPLIADQVGGLVGLSLAAFGAVGGICHGVAERENFSAHALRQSVTAIEELNAQPELKRIDHLLGKMLPETGRNLRKAKRIKIADEALTKRLSRKSDRLDLLHQTLERLNGELEAIPFALEPITRMKSVKKAG